MCKRKYGFTLVELLVVIAIMTMLLSILMPALSAARAQARSAVCRSNIRQLVMANTGYATENRDCYVAAASDMWNNSGLHRWHGVRKDINSAFDPLKGPLASYLGNGKVKECPERVDFLKSGSWNLNFEAGCGGYGYNMLYIGSRQWESGISTMEEWRNAYARTSRSFEVRQPAETIMFADCAMSNVNNGTITYIEYSFVEPPFNVYNGEPFTYFYMSPSIHFRHSKNANIGWVDGHVEARAMAPFNSENAYGVNSSAAMLGWLDPIDNSLYDLK